MIKIKKWNASIAIIVLIVFLACKTFETFFQQLDYRTSQIYITAFAIVIYAFVLFVIKVANGRVDVFFVYVFLGFFFSFGRHLLFVFAGIDSFNNALSEDSIIRAGFWHIYAVLFMCLGYLLAPNGKYRNVKKKDYDQSIVINVAVAFLIVSIIPYFYQAIQNISITRMYGYGYRIIENENRASLLGLLSGFCLPSLTLLYFYVKNKKLPLLGILVCLGMQLISGTRIESVCYLVILLFWEYNAIQNPKDRMRFCLVGGSIGICLVFLFSIISYDRSALSRVRSLSDILSYIHNYTMKESVIASILEETGSNFQVLACAMQNCPDNVSYNYGYSYLYSIIYVFPNMLTRSIFPACVNTDDAFAHFLVSYGGVGSSYAAEAYYNFGQFGLLFLIIWGMLWRSLSNFVKRVSIGKEKIGNFIAFEISLKMIFTVRSDIVYSVRGLVWNTGVILFAVFIFNSLLFHNKSTPRIILNGDSKK